MGKPFEAEIGGIETESFSEQQAEIEAQPNKRYAREIHGTEREVHESRQALVNFLKSNGVALEMMIPVGLLHDELVNNEMMHGYDLGRVDWPAEKQAQSIVEFRAVVSTNQEGTPVLEMTVEAKGTAVSSDKLKTYFEIPEQPQLTKVVEQPAGTIVEKPGRIASHFPLTRRTVTMEGSEKESGRGRGIIANYSTSVEVIFFENEPVLAYPTEKNNRAIDHEMVVKMSLDPANIDDSKLAAAFDPAQFDLTGLGLEETADDYHKAA